MSIAQRFIVAIFIVSFITPSAWATKARLQSLQGARFLTDTQLVFENPAQIHGLKNYVTYELGTSNHVNTTTTPNTLNSPKSEGGIIKDNLFGGRGGIYLGHLSEGQTLFRLQNGFLIEENPFELFWGKDDWAASIGFSDSDKDSTNEKQQTFIARFGIDRGDFEVWANAEFVAKSERGSDTYKGAPLLAIGGEKHLENDLYINGEINYGQIKTTVSNSTNSIDVIGLEVALLDRSIKTKTAEIYYGPQFSYFRVKSNNQEQSQYSLPFYIGMIYRPLEWLEARASVSQNLLLGKGKTEINTPASSVSDTIANNTTISTGVGFNLKDFTIDATLTGSTTGQFNTTQMLANIGLIYNF